MERFASAYGRALLPRRLAPREGVNGHGGPGDSGPGDGGRGGSGQPMALVPGDLELAMGAGIYRVVGAVESLLDGVRQRAARWRARPAPRRRATPVGCG